MLFCVKISKYFANTFACPRRKIILFEGGDKEKEQEEGEEEDKGDKIGERNRSKRRRKGRARI